MKFFRLFILLGAVINGGFASDPENGSDSSGSVDIKKLIGDAKPSLIEPFNNINQEFLKSSFVKKALKAY